jgi:hypothetical protein
MCSSWIHRAAMHIWAVEMEQSRTQVATMVRGRQFGLLIFPRARVDTIYVFTTSPCDLLLF